MSISRKVPDAATALLDRIVVLERQIAELGVLRNRIAEAESRRYQSGAGRRACAKQGARRKSK
jgi:hypothetical protein